MPELDLFEIAVTDDDGNALAGVSVDIYMEGAVVNGTQSGVSPLDVAVYSSGKVKRTGTENVLVDAGSTVYSVASASVTDTNVRLQGFAGTLALTSGSRLIPAQNRPRLYVDKKGTTQLGSATLQ